ncbi:MAG: DUF2344 domain-containing protein [Spirochaetales bacterium]|nr:DUF2344 domain-containing protein [Spirochaetales bacterium]
MEKRIIPERDLRTVLPRVEKPGRYVGGEFGSVLKEGDNLLRVVISYPDLYEIGMSNTSVRLIYRLLNAMEGVACERVFAPARDFEAELRARGLPLYALESGRPLGSFDLVGFSMGYELTFTNMLTILDLGGIPILRRERGEGDPIVVAGGPAITNPVPFGRVIDAVFVGEIEGEGIQLFATLAEARARGAGRAELLELLVRQPFVWSADKGEPVRRVLWRGFGTGSDRDREGGGMAFPIPSIRTVQDHGVVEIMRGCPHGCRFCHAGVFYRPYRMKDPAAIVAEVDEQVLRHGYREVTLASLSTGDYPGVGELVRFLNARYADQRVSFNLPSLRISSLTLDLLSEVSAVRKTGLTFAVETPLAQWQAGINKPVSGGRTVELLKEARGRGWRQAKFYFMIGLPVARGQDECGPILELLSGLREQVRMELVVNVSSFIPKPHTPFQWAPQLTEQEALDRIMRVKRSAPKGVNVRYHSPFLSVLEGVVSRGDERAGELFVEAFRRGARFDSWEDLADRKLWRGLFAEAAWDVEGETCRERALEEALPWHGIRLGVTESFLKREAERALAGVETPDCSADCGHACGVCREDVRVRDVAPVPDLSALAASLPVRPATPFGEHRRVLFSFSKRGRAVFLGHLDLMQVFERALLRAGYVAVFTEGYNPKPRLEFAQPLPLGITAEAEIARVEVANFDQPDGFRGRLNAALPEGIAVGEVRAAPPLAVGEKKLSIMAAYWGAEYRVEDLSEGQIDGLIDALAAHPDPPVQMTERGAGSLTLRTIRREKGPANILRMLEELGLAEAPRGSVTVTRVRLLAAAPGTEEAPRAYFEVY